MSELHSAGLERLEWNEAIRGISFHSKLFVSILNFQATEQPTRTLINPTDCCGGTAQLDPKTGVPSRGKRVLLTQKMNFHANILQGKPPSRRCEPSKSHLRGKSRSYDIAIAARRRLLKFLWTSVPRICHKYIARVSFAAPSFPSYCLLYTSPSPRDQRGSRMPSSA